MKANELRIGNIIGSIHTDITWKVDLFLFNEIFDDQTYLDHLKPIPLTEEWLINFGFYNSERLKNSFIKNGVHIYIQDTAFWYDLANDSIEVKTIHQLQNLYFALTGEELTMK